MLIRASAFAALLASTMPGIAQSIDAESPANVLAVLQDLGYLAAQDTDEHGDPRILSAAGGKPFRIDFYGCEGGQHCQSIQFTSGFDLEEPMAPEQVNVWNSTNRFAKVMLDEEGDPYLDYDVNLAAGGIPIDNFKTTVALWDSLMGEFISYVGW